jgi:predicted dehydrogenase
MRKLGIAIVGTGMIGAVHRRAALLAGAEVRGVAASSSQRAREIAQAWDVARAYGDIGEIIADPQVQVVHVCTPNHLHRTMAQAALEAGKHVICEKPLATTVDDARALAALAASTGLVATVPFVYRYHPVVREARAHRAGRAGAAAADPWQLSAGLAAGSGQQQLARGSGAGRRIARVRRHRLALVRPGGMGGR